MIDSTPRQPEPVSPGHRLAGPKGVYVPFDPSKSDAELLALLIEVRDQLRASKGLPSLDEPARNDPQLHAHLRDQPEADQD